MNVGFLWKSLLFLLSLTLLCSLGFWQLSRAQYKQTLIDQAQLAQTTITLDEQKITQIPLNQARFQHIKFSTSLQNKNIILLDNQVLKGQVGYHVLVPARLNNQQAILINRGFVPIGKNRQELPSILPISGPVTIEGYLDIAYRNPLIKQAIDGKITWPLRVQQIDFNLLSTLMGISLYPMLVTLNEDSPYVLTPLPKATTYLTPEKHIGYAVQWFSLALAFLIWFIYFLYRSKQKV